VCPIFKNGEKCNFTNYRPISVLPSISKIFEKAVSNRLMSFLQLQNILINNQYGFRPKHSTYMALLDMYDKISNAIDRHEFSVGIFIDLSKAFDTINHGILINKLEHYGIRGITLDWFKNYLSNRQQYVYLCGSSSSLGKIDCGVPQGSVLGPLLFIIYINDVIQCSDILKFILFADDTNLFYCNKNLSELEYVVNYELSKLSDWFRANKLSLNALKTNFMLFGNKVISEKSVQFKLILDGNVLERVTVTKFLGIFVDDKLKWTHQVNHISSKISKGLGMMGRVRNVMPNDVLLTLYYSLIYPYLTYCSIIWGGASTTSLQRLCVLQNRAVRLITRSPFRATTTPLYAQLKLLKIADIRKLHILLFMYKCKHKILPEPCLQLCPVNTVIPYSIRYTHYFVVPTFRTSLREQNISTLGPRFWDTISSDFQNLTSIDLFKRHVSSYLISLYTAIIL
jgi:hypothetical protein